MTTATETSPRSCRHTAKTTGRLCAQRPATGADWCPVHGGARQRSVAAADALAAQLATSATGADEQPARRWRHDETFPGITVTRDGRVLSYRRGLRHELAQRQKENRYLTVQIWIGDRSRVRKVHALVAGAFLPPPPSPAHVIRHLNGDMLDNRAANLAWGTQLENMRDAVRHGVLRRGEAVRTAVLTEDLVREIRRLSESGWSNVGIAAHLGMPRQRIYHVVIRRSWRHVA